MESQFSYYLSHICHQSPSDIQKKKLPFHSIQFHRPGTYDRLQMKITSCDTYVREHVKVKFSSRPLLVHPYVGSSPISRKPLSCQFWAKTTLSPVHSSSLIGRQENPRASRLSFTLERRGGRLSSAI